MFYPSQPLVSIERLIRSYPGSTVWLVWVVLAEGIFNSINRHQSQHFKGIYAIPFSGFASGRGGPGAALARCLICCCGHHDRTEGPLKFQRCGSDKTLCFEKQELL